MSGDSSKHLANRKIAASSPSETVMSQDLGFYRLVSLMHPDKRTYLDQSNLYILDETVSSKQVMQDWRTSVDTTYTPQFRTTLAALSPLLHAIVLDPRKSASLPWPQGPWEQTTMLPMVSTHMDRAVLLNTVLTHLPAWLQPEDIRFLGQRY